MAGTYRALNGATNVAGEVGERCPTCGANVLTGCPKCRTRIRGYYHVPGVTSFTGDYTPPRFCDSCGAPFPWLDRQGRIFELENMLDDEDPMMPQSSQSASSSARSPIPTSTRARSASAGNRQALRAGSLREVGREGDP